MSLSWAEAKHVPSQPHAIVGGDTSVTLTSADTLAQLGVSVSGLGTASLDGSGNLPIADFAITGGTAGPDAGSAVILHQGSGLELSDSAGTIDLQDFRIDTDNATVFANVSVDGQAAGNVGVFAIGDDGTTLLLTEAAASAADQALGTDALTEGTTIGTAAPHASIVPEALGPAVVRFLSNISLDGSLDGDTSPIVGGATSVTLESAGTLQSLGVSVTSIGSASINTSGATPVAEFPVTGGTEGPNAGEAVILHQGSGLELSDEAGTVDLKNFVVDTQNAAVDATVVANGTRIGVVPVFDIGTDGTTLTLSSAAETAVNECLGLDLSGAVTIGTASPAPVVLPGGFASALIPIEASAPLHCGVPSSS